jgi:hypothetical protein
VLGWADLRWVCPASRPMEPAVCDLSQVRKRGARCFPGESELRVKCLMKKPEYLQNLTLAC